MGGEFTYGTSTLSNKITLAENMSFSVGKFENNTFEVTKSVWDKKGTVSNSARESVFTYSGTRYNTLTAIVGKDNKLEENDLKELAKKPPKNIQITDEGNGVYLVKFKVPGEYTDSWEGIQFDFETAEEKETREQQEQIEAENKAKETAEKQRIKDEEAKKASTKKEPSTLKQILGCFKFLWTNY